MTRSKRESGTANAPKIARKTTDRAGVELASRATTTRPQSQADAKGRLDPAASALMHKGEHPLAPEIETVRKLILGVHPSIQEAVKWNSPSFRTTDFFATVNLRSKDRVQLVFHTGAKVKGTAKTGLAIADPAGLCEWLAKDRCLVTLGVGKELAQRGRAFAALVREWIKWV